MTYLENLKLCRDAAIDSMEIGLAEEYQKRIERATDHKTWYNTTMELYSDEYVEGLEV